jgi:hypothetical protein
VSAQCEGDLQSVDAHWERRYLSYSPHGVP